MLGRTTTLLSSLALGACLLGTGGCFVTSIGMDRPEVRAQTDFGPPETLRVCALLDDGISQRDAQETLQDYWNQNEASKYNLSVKLVSYTSLPRPMSEFFHWQIASKVAMRRIPSGCDRTMYFVNRNVLDTLWSVPEAYGAPEVLGEVDDYTMTRGYVIDRIASLNQVLLSPWFSPAKVARHETYHMLGCAHGLLMDQCYKHIAEAKWIENRLRGAGCYEKSKLETFFPAFSHAGEGPILLTHAQGDSVLGLEKDASFNRFMQCARDAGLPVDEKGMLQTASADDWMNKAIEQAHRETIQPVVATASPVGGTPDRVSAAAPPSTPATAASPAQTPAAHDRQAAASSPTAPISRADTAMVDLATNAATAAYPGMTSIMTSAPSSTEFALPRT
ncbi:MAG TPA: hypothetical protein VNE82_10890 [Candidatus Binataceae bacterium]|nr:hypothetical protein [Candidatus Binataceae bacterium]